MCYTCLESGATLLVHNLLATSHNFIVKKTVWIQTLHYSESFQWESITAASKRDLKTRSSLVIFELSAFYICAAAGVYFSMISSGLPVRYEPHASLRSVASITKSKSELLSVSFYRSGHSRNSPELVLPPLKSILYLLIYLGPGRGIQVLRKRWHLFKVCLRGSCSCNEGRGAPTGWKQADGEKTESPGENHTRLPPSDLGDVGGCSVWFRRNNGSPQQTQSRWRAGGGCVSVGRFNLPPTSHTTSPSTIISWWKILQRLLECGALMLRWCWRSLGGRVWAVCPSQKVLASFRVLLQTGISVNSWKWYPVNPHLQSRVHHRTYYHSPSLSLSLSHPHTHTHTHRPFRVSNQLEKMHICTRRTGKFKPLKSLRDN